MKGRFIVIEGIDGSGKKTQLDLLEKRLKRHGYQVEQLDFPRYQENAFGRLVGRYLAGEFGELGKVSPYFLVLAYMLDQYLGHRCIESWINDGRMVIANRYFTSNVHQIVKFPAGKEREKFRGWLWRTGWDELGLYKPDLVILLLVPPRVSRRLTGQKDQRVYLQEKLLDIAESDLDHQAAAYEEYRRTAGEEAGWVTLNCLDAKGNLKSPAQVHKEIWALLEDKKIVRS